MENGLPRQTCLPGAILGQRLRAFGRLAVDTLLPARCLNCGTPVSGAAGLCGPCFAAVTWLEGPQCDHCALPLTPTPAPPPSGPGAGLRCAVCRHAPPPFARARAALLYDAASRDILLRFKHADHSEAAPALARWLARRGADLLPDAGLLVPVPLHWWRLLQRRYNQAALLCAALSRCTGVAWAPDALRRRRHTISQGRFDRRSGGDGSQARKENVRDAFRVVKPARIAGKTVVLVDDVMTTGATAAECARVLKASGARSVDVLVVARAVPGNGGRDV